MWTCHVKSFKAFGVVLNFQTNQNRSKFLKTEKYKKRKATVSLGPAQLQAATVEAQPTFAIIYLSPPRVDCARHGRRCQMRHRPCTLREGIRPAPAASFSCPKTLAPFCPFPCSRSRFGRRCLVAVMTTTILEPATVSSSTTMSSSFSTLIESSQGAP